MHHCCCCKQPSYSYFLCCAYRGLELELEQQLSLLRILPIILAPPLLQLEAWILPSSTRSRRCTPSANPLPSTVTTTYEHIDQHQPPASINHSHLVHAFLDALGLRQTSPRLGKAQLQLHEPFPDGPRSLWRHTVRVQRPLEQHSKVLLVITLSCNGEKGGEGGGTHDNASVVGELHISSPRKASEDRQT